MKLISLILAVFLFFITRVFGADGDYRARYCELFISKVEKLEGRFGARSLVFFINTRNDRLDSGIKEVGFFYRGTVTPKEGFTYEEYHTQKAGKLGPYSYMVELPVAHDDATIKYTGSFYVRTASNSTYWLNTRSGGDFVIDENTYYDLLPFEFNPDNCY